jgi:nitrite reductase (NADH) large subunit
MNYASTGLVHDHPRSGPWEAQRLRSAEGKKSLVMIGNGMAGVRTLEELIKLAPDLYDITVFSAEPYPNYNRILLSPLLAGEQTLAGIMLNGIDWYAAHGITLHLNRSIARIDRVRRLVYDQCGEATPYDRLLLATGSTPFILPVPGNDLEGVLTYRDIEDTNRMIAAAARYRRAVVIGGGLLGLEAANGLRARGMDVTVLHLMPWLMERQLDRCAAQLLQESLARRGIVFHLCSETSEIAGDGGRVCAVRCKNGRIIPADLVVMAVGIRPNAELAQAAGLHCDRGVVVSDTLQTFDPHIYAVGECVAHRGMSYGLVAPLYEMSRVCANHLAFQGMHSYRGSVVSTRLKVTGIDLFSAGSFMGGTDTEEIVLQDAPGGIYKKLVIRQDRLVGSVLYGDAADSAWYLDLIRERTDISRIRDYLMFGRSLAERAPAARESL